MWFYVQYDIETPCILLEYILLESKSYELAVGNKRMRILINAYPRKDCKNICSLTRETHLYGTLPD